MEPLRRVGRAPAKPTTHREKRSIQPKIFDRAIRPPICANDSSSHEIMNRRVWPINRPRNKSMLDGVEMDVIDVPRVIRVIANDVLPESTLPDAAFVLLRAAL